MGIEGVEEAGMYEPDDPRVAAVYEQQRSLGLDRLRAADSFVLIVPWHDHDHDDEDGMGASVLIAADVNFVRCASNALNDAYVQMLATSVHVEVVAGLTFEQLVNLLMGRNPDEQAD